MNTGTKLDRSPHQMEPLLVGRRDELASRTLQLATAATRLEGTVQGATRAAIAGLVREMNCYYSNLIEGANTLPLDIERALRDEFAPKKEVRDLQKLALSHIAAESQLEAEVDRGAMPTSPEVIAWVHGAIYKDLPRELMKLNDGSMLVPGRPRDIEVKVGNHVAPGAASVPALLDRFHSVYGKLEPSVASIPEVMAAHHRLTWIHPFADGNGRVARLITGAMLRKCGANTDSLWSLSRGLARDATTYKTMLANADAPRRGDLDGRGNLSLGALVEFCVFMMDRAIDQAEFMTRMLDLPRLASRVQNYFRQARADVKFEGAHLVNQALAFGEMERGEAARISGLSERVARDLVGQLLEEGLLVTDSPRGRLLRAGFPVKARGYFFPNLYPAGLDGPVDDPEIRKLARAPRRRI
ncbi:hypothetical protein BWI17_18125 [Betaproteobacteria bacterium GR16-43]|nr:hypothetical protein BWI17_18125 [Betaproteobacteria bacterium GR16-43]